MKLAIMQPYFIPYIGYWQLLAIVDTLVIYDDIKYTKQSWINRNKLMELNGKEHWITIPLINSSDYLSINQKKIAETFEPQSILSFFETNYKRTKNFKIAMEIFQKILLTKNDNLFEFINEAIRIIKDFLEININIIKSSELSEHQKYAGKEKVISICHELEASTYINLSGGQQLYDSKYFNDKDILLKFIKYCGLNEKDKQIFSIIHDISVMDYKEIKDKIETNYVLL